jgi:DNA-binding NarL/FixJ family response regulator
LSIAAAPRDASAGGTQSRLKMQILLIDEAGILRDGLCALLQNEKGIEVIAVAANRREAMQALSAQRPALVIMDFSAAAKIGPETISQLKRRWPRLRVLVLTLRRDPQFIDAARRAGADGYLLKNESRAELFKALQRLSAGKNYLSPSAAEAMTSTDSENSGHSTAVAQPALLTNREQEVIALIARGYRTREMAQLMSLSSKTVEKHRTNLMRKLGLRSAAAVAAYAITHGYL